MPRRPGSASTPAPRVRAAATRRTTAANDTPSSSTPPPSEDPPSTNGTAPPRPARPKLTAAEKLAKQEARARKENLQLDIMKTRVLVDDAKMLKGVDRKTANVLAREAAALSVLAGRLGGDHFLRLRAEIGDDIAKLQRDDPATKDAVAALEESGTTIDEAGAP